MVLSLYIVIAIYSTVYSYRRLNRPGVSAKVRALFLRKHFVYVCVFIAIWMIQQMNNYNSLFNPPAEKSANINSAEMMMSYPSKAGPTAGLHALGAYLGFRTVPNYANYNGAFGAAASENDIGYLTIASAAMSFCTGIFLAGARFFEPLFRILFIQFFYNLYGEIYEPKLEEG